jgi:hypothetical protein
MVSGMMLSCRAGDLLSMLLVAVQVESISSADLEEAVISYCRCSGKLHPTQVPCTLAAISKQAAIIMMLPIQAIATTPSALPGCCVVDMHCMPVQPSKCVTELAVHTIMQPSEPVMVLAYIYSSCHPL